jgi:hypothetical protein
MKKVYLILSALALLITSCQQPEKVDSLTNPSHTNEVQLETVLKVAKNFDALISISNGKGGAKNARTGAQRKTVKKVTPFNDGKGKTQYYVITYQEGGFIIVSAEKKMMPVIAFSETNDFPIDKELPSGVRETMSLYQEMIKKMRFGELPEDPLVVQEWKRFEDTSKIEELTKSGAKTADDPVDPPCEDSQVYYGPLLTTNWGQDCGYNSDMPVLAGCVMPCDHAFTGCVATAMAQVMNYHHFPNNFNWGAMGAWQPQTQLLMRTNADRVSMTYTCGGSGAFPSVIPGVFVLGYGYNSGAYHANFNSSVIMNEISIYSRPVILSGWNSSGGGGHTWVADGYFQTYTCSNGWSEPMIHMNWGWNGNHNGFYSNYNPAGFDFNYSKKMDANIHP